MPPLPTRGPNRRAFLMAGASMMTVAASMNASRSAWAKSEQPESLPSHHRPMFIDGVGLRVLNLEGMILFYQQVIGLELMSRTKKSAVLGIGGAALVELAAEPGARAAPPGEAGLYHLAFEMPTRLDLARWMTFVAKYHFQVSGLADHRVTESVYLNDPDGNGVEVYASRPEDQWQWAGGQVAMGVFDLDVDPLLSLARSSGSPYSGAPAAMRIGHIHLKVDDVAAAEAFYSGLIGFDVTRRASGVVFMSSGRYHHHVAANVWESPGAKQRSMKAAGLSWFVIAMDHSTLARHEERLRAASIKFRKTDQGLEIQDPWGNSVRLVEL